MEKKSPLCIQREGVNTLCCWLLFQVLLECLQVVVYKPLIKLASYEINVGLVFKCLHVSCYQNNLCTPRFNTRCSSIKFLIALGPSKHKFPQILYALPLCSNLYNFRVFGLLFSLISFSFDFSLSLSLSLAITLSIKEYSFSLCRGLLRV